MYLLLSSDTNLALFDRLIERAGFVAERIATRSIWVEAFYLYELRLTSDDAVASAAS